MCVCVCSGGYNIQDVQFYWTRGNDSVKGLGTLRLAQYSVESYHTTVSQAVYETGKNIFLHYTYLSNHVCTFGRPCIQSDLQCIKNAHFISECVLSGN